MREFPLPTEFAELSGKVSHVQMNTPNHFRSSCPECKDYGHNPQNGPPDRFQMWVRSQTTGGPLGWCSRCGYKWWPGRESGDAPDPETIKLLKQQAEARQKAQDAVRREKLAEFSTQEIWKEYCERMEKAQQDWWLSQGIPLVAQTYLSLGYTPERKYRVGENLYSSPAYTIPWFGYNFDFLTMQFRLTNPINPSDKYRFEYGLEGGATHFYRADPAEKIGDKVIVCEGAKKAIVTRYQLLPASTDFVVLATAAKNTIEPVLEAVKDSGLVYIIFDPDDITYSFEMARTLGKTAHVVRLPFKVDDGFVHYGLQPKEFVSILDTAL